MSKTAKPDFTLYKNAARIGSGVWFMNHLKSFHIESEADILSLYRDITLLQVYFSCNTCKDHLNEYCKQHPPVDAMERDLDDFKNKKEPENLARWLVDAHNNANYQRFVSSGNSFKPEDAKYEDVKEFFKMLGQTPCEKDCDKPLVTEPIKPVEQVKTIKTGKLRVRAVKQF